MKKNVIVILSVIAIIALIGFKLAFNKKKLDEKKKPVLSANVAIPVSTATVAVSKVSGEIFKVGTANPFQESDIMAVSPGKIVNMNCELGKYVKKGEVITSLDTRALQLALQKEELNLNKLKTDRERYKVLFAGNAASESDLNTIELNYQTSENRVADIKRQIADANIVAPISGRITKKNYEEGEFVNAGMAIANLVDISRLKVKVMVSESEAYAIKEGQNVKVTSDIYPDLNLAGKITFISPVGDDAHNYPVEVVVNNNSSSQLKAGTYVKVEFGSQKEGSALQIPRDALIESIKNPIVYVVESGVAKKKPIKVGREFGITVEVLEGLKEGEVVVTNGQINLFEGSQIQVVK